MNLGSTPVEPFSCGPQGLCLMARLVEINGPRQRDEREAQERLSEILPASWLVTTNIKERNFRRNAREIDSLVICPFGVFKIDFKYYAARHIGGRITPQMNSSWGGLKKGDNPFEQAEDAVFPVKNKLEDDTGEEWFINWLIVLTHPDAILDWTDSDCRPDIRPRVCAVDDVQQSIESVGRSCSLDGRRASLILQAFKPDKLAAHLSFVNEKWTAPTQEPRKASTSSGPEFDWSAVLQHIPRTRSTPYSSQNPDIKPMSCPGCGGRGKVRYQQGFYSMERTCEACQGRGTLKDPPVADRIRVSPRPSMSPTVGHTTVLYTIGIIASIAVAFFGLFKLTYCDDQCQYRRRVAQQEEEQREFQRKNPPPPPLPAHSNISSDCTGIIIDRWETTGAWRKLPGGGYREGGWNMHKNPCAIHYAIVDGLLAFGNDSGVGIYSWQEGNAPRAQWPVTIDLVQSARLQPSRWRVIFCREWHPVMKEWRCR